MAFVFIVHHIKQTIKNKEMEFYSQEHITTTACHTTALTPLFLDVYTK